MRVANAAKEHLAAGLLKDGLITEEIYTKIVEEYVLILREKGILGSTFDKVWGEPEKDSMRWDVMRTTGCFGRKDGKIEVKSSDENRFSKIEE